MIPAVTASEYIYSKLGSNASLLPLFVKDISNSTGLTIGSYITGKDVEGKDRFIDEFGTQAIWLGGIPFFKKLTDLTLYKLLGVDPKFDVRNLKNKEILEKAIEKAPTEEIKQSIIKASKNPKYTKNLALAKFGFSTFAAIFTYAGLTKFRQNYRLQEAKEKLKEKSKAKIKNFHNFYTQKVPKAFSPVHKNKKDISFNGSIQDFMFNPVQNLMILDGSITAERLASSQSKQEFINYSIKPAPSGRRPDSGPAPSAACAAKGIRPYGKPAVPEDGGTAPLFSRSGRPSGACFPFCSFLPPITYLVKYFISPAFVCQFQTGMVKNI